ncbi:MAG: heme-binding domain-containing protein [Candidatus Binataceae bacterium]|nr:heme-binding domain-containing protein [Candidatus Binataceae bacterium]
MIFGRLAWIAGVACIAAAVAVQLVPVERTNPPSLGTLAAPPEIEATLKRACYDCHSSATRWPWYSHVAPVSWLVVRDVNLGRKEVNFSAWGRYYPVTRRRKLEWIGRALRDGKMPPWNYRLMHPDARLTAADQAALEQWVEAALATPSTERSK